MRKSALWEGVPPPRAPHRRRPEAISSNLRQSQAPTASSAASKKARSNLKQSQAITGAHRLERRIEEGHALVRPDLVALRLRRRGRRAVVSDAHRLPRALRLCRRAVMGTIVLARVVACLIAAGGLLARVVAGVSDGADGGRRRGAARAPLVAPLGGLWPPEGPRLLGCSRRGCWPHVSPSVGCWLPEGDVREQSVAAGPHRGLALAQRLGGRAPRAARRQLRC